PYAFLAGDRSINRKKEFEKGPRAGGRDSHTIRGGKVRELVEGFFLTAAPDKAKGLRMVGRGRDKPSEDRHVIGLHDDGVVGEEIPFLRQLLEALVGCLERLREILLLNIV